MHLKEKEEVHLFGVIFFTGCSGDQPRPPETQNSRKAEPWPEGGAADSPTSTAAASGTAERRFGGSTAGIGAK